MTRDHAVCLHRASHLNAWYVLTSEEHQGDGTAAVVHVHLETRCPGTTTSGNRTNRTDHARILPLVAVTHGDGPGRLDGPLEVLRFQRPIVRLQPADDPPPPATPVSHSPSR
jgi:hypothetical protein